MCTLQLGLTGIMHWINSAVPGWETQAEANGRSVFGTKRVLEKGQCIFPGYESSVLMHSSP